MKQFLVQYTPSELDWSIDEPELVDAPPSVRAVEPPTTPVLPHYDLDEANDSLSPTPLATPALPADAWPFESPKSEQDASYVGSLPQRDARESMV